MSASEIWLIVYAVVHGGVIVRVLAVSDREPLARAAWVLVLVFVPAVGIGAYALFGEPWVARRFRHKAGSALLALDSEAFGHRHAALTSIPECFQPAFQTCQQLGAGFTTGGNRATLAAGSNAAIDAMVDDFDAAHDSIHISFYIWLADNNGLKVVRALERAAARGVRCRVIADGIGSRDLIQSQHWTAMQHAGVRLCTSMKLSFGLAAILGNRVDLRNHRKIIIVDNGITWCGSQNCADPEFRVKAQFAPWVDIMVRFEGPVVSQNQRIFATNWMTEVGEDLSAFVGEARPEPLPDGFQAVAFGTGPTSPRRGMSDVFVSLLYTATRKVVISTPYFVPDPSLLGALMCCARRGVDTTLILPARNDSWEVAAISKAHYAQLVGAGVMVFEFCGGLLHAKTLIADGAIVLIGSANMDRRSLELNFENNILAYSPALAGAIGKRQDAWLANARQVDAAAIAHRPLLRRIGENIVAMFGPLF
jgi:cardiolipin synthase